MFHSRSPSMYVVNTRIRVPAILSSRGHSSQHGRHGSRYLRHWCLLWFLDRFFSQVLFDKVKAIQFLSNICMASFRQACALNCHCSQALKLWKPLCQNWHWTLTFNHIHHLIQWLWSLLDTKRAAKSTFWFHFEISFQWLFVESHH